MKLTFSHPITSSTVDVSGADLTAIPSDTSLLLEASLDSIGTLNLFTMTVTSSADEHEPCLLYVLCDFCTNTAVDCQNAKDNYLKNATVLQVIN